ncbi:MAG: type II secretion system F family protein [Negativicutes bacterium]|nr:type II secretion system F family protein [Negativicutes bacterium]
MVALIALSAFLTIMVGLAAIWYYAVLPKQTIRDRIGHYIEPSSTADVRTELLHKPSLTGWRATVRRLSRHFEWSGQSRGLENKLIRAGLPLRGSEFATVWAGSMVGCAAVLFVISGGNPLMTSVGIVVGFIVPKMFLSIKAAKRIRQLNDQLSDALVLVANSLRTGYSFLQAIEMVAREMTPPISQEFARMLKEINLGITTEDALNNMARRVGSDDLDLVVTAVLIQRQVGGNLAEVLDNIAGTIRSRIKLKGEIRTLTAQGRISGLVVGLMPFVMGLLMTVANPDYMQGLFTHPAGKMMLGAALVSQLFGIMLVRKIVDIRL